MRTLYIFTLIIASSLAYSQDLKCSDFKIGTFKIECINYKLPTTKVIRTQKIQKESAVGIELEQEGTIEWKSECSYELVYTKNVAPEMAGKKISAEIIKIEGRKAICKSTCEGFEGFTIEFEMEKLN